MVKRMLLFSGCVLLACLLTAPAHARVQISYVEATADGNTALILGQHFGSRPIVYMDDLNLDVLESSDNFVRFKLWENAEAGTYKLFVKNKDKRKKRSYYYYSRHAGTTDHIDFTLAAAAAPPPDDGTSQECSCEIDQEEYETLLERMEQIEAIPMATEQLAALMARVEQLEDLQNGAEEIEALLARVETLEALLSLPGEFESLEDRVEALENAAGQEEVPCLDNSACGAGQYCEKPLASCYAEGICRSLPDSCDDILEPVCGCDYTTYDNSCEAAAAGISVRMTGECLPL